MSSHSQESMSIPDSQRTRGPPPPSRPFQYHHHPTMRILFAHPDLGIGGAERLVVDAAVGLQRRGHTVRIFTSHHDRGHAFAETCDGTCQRINE